MWAAYHLALFFLATVSRNALAQAVDPANDPRNPQHYVPNTSYAYAGFGVYLAVVVGCLAWSIRYRAIYMLVLMVSSSLYAISLMLRTVFASDPHSVSKFVAMRLMTLIPAGGFFILIYVLFAQLVVHLEAVNLLPLSPNVVAITYTVLEIVCISIQSIGAALSPSSLPSNRSLGRTIILVGFIAQIVSMLAFTSTYIVFVFRLKKTRPEEWKARPHGRFKHFTIFVYMLGFACQGLLIRTAYRLLEAAQGPNGKLAKSELWFYMLDALQLLNAIIGFVILWPPYHLRHAMRTHREDPSNVELRESAEQSKITNPDRTYNEV
ncbi:hypothetical protein FRC07_009644 [Ceratobasidium sp. 392]|nr:hypothetical protein FRC07_009644 [Ceratobasidium sp. 392]